MKDKKLVHWKEATGSRYIGAYAIEDELKVKIISIAVEEVSSANGRIDNCIVAQLDGNNKPFIINKTNSKTISEIASSPYIEDWVGKEIILFATTTNLKGEVVETLRVRKPKTVLDEKHDSFKQIQEAIKKGSYNIEQIEKKYEITPEIKKLLTNETI
jgi:hypothetical protein